MGNSTRGVERSVPNLPVPHISSRNIEDLLTKKDDLRRPVEEFNQTKSF